MKEERQRIKSGRKEREKKLREKVFRQKRVKQVGTSVFIPFDFDWTEITLIMVEVYDDSFPCLLPFFGRNKRERERER